jgi:hypothetical protein
MEVLNELKDNTFFISGYGEPFDDMLRFKYLKDEDIFIVTKNRDHSERLTYEIVNDSVKFKDYTFSKDCILIHENQTYYPYFKDFIVYLT